MMATVKMRTRKADLELIDSAAKALGVSRSSFIRSTAEERARSVMGWGWAGKWADAEAAKELAVKPELTKEKP